jgi:uncharacterized protein (TIGR00730 family)
MKPPKLVKAYKNAEFLSSPQARLIRILSEMLEPEARFRKYNIRDTVVFFGSAKILPGSRRRRAGCAPELSRYYDCAAQLSERLTRYFLTLKKRGKNFMVCSGGGPGIMAAASYGAKSAGGKSIGLNISLPVKQYPNPFQSPELAFEFHYFFIRKFWFFYLAKALVVFPGGFGTMDELFELLTLMQTGKSRKRMSVVLFGKDYWSRIINFEKMVEWGTISKGDLGLFKMADTVDEAFDILKTDLERFDYTPAHSHPAES